MNASYVPRAGIEPEVQQLVANAVAKVAQPHLLLQQQQQQAAVSKGRRGVHSEVQGDVHASDEEEVQSEDDWEEVEVDDGILPEVNCGMHQVITGRLQQRCAMVVKRWCWWLYWGAAQLGLGLSVAVCSCRLR
jgi:hypothetical protein